MRRWAAAVLTSAVLVVGAAPALACDPDWDWCGYDWYDPYSYQAPAYEEPASSWIWWDEPVYEPPAVIDPPVVYEPIAAYAPPAVYEPLPLYQPEPVYEPAPMYDAPVIADTPSYTWAPDPAPVMASPSWSDPFAWASPGSDVLDASIPPAPQSVPAAVAAVPDPDAQRGALGLQWVTEVYAGDSVTTEGLVTTYSSSTLAMDAGTAARIVAGVGTGEASAYDALLWNRRMVLSDGRPVKGEIYANYTWDGYDWMFDKYVFFQDDLEIARISAPPATPVTAPPATPPSGPAAPVVRTPPVSPAITSATAPAFVAPLTGDVPAPPTPGSSAPAAPGGSRPSPLLRAGVALAPQADPLGRIEVLRGRRVPLWVRATLDGAPARVVGWRLVAGELTALGPVSGSGDEPLVATWRSISASGAAFSVALRASVEVPAEGIREVDATIDVVVRSPALVE